MAQKRFFQDLESGEFQVAFDASRHSNKNGKMNGEEENASTDDLVSRLSDPQSLPSTSRQRSATWSPTRSFLIKHPLQYIRNKVAKKNHQNTYHKEQQYPSEELNLLGRFQDTEEEEEQRVLPSPTFFLSSPHHNHQESPDDEHFVFEDSPKSGILSHTSSCASSSYSARIIPGAPAIKTPHGFSGNWGYLFLAGYLLLGACVFHSYLQVEGSDWTLVDSLYACLSVVLTIGYPLEGLTSQQHFLWSAYAIIGSSCVLILALLYVMQQVLDSTWVRQQTNQAIVLRALNGLSTTIPRSWNHNNSLLRVVVGLWLPFVIAKISGWSVDDTMYFLVHTAFTIGQGGVSPTTQPAKILAILWIPLAVGSVFQGLTGVARYFYCPTEKSCETTRHQLECTLQELELSSPAGKVMTRAEFLEVALISMNQMDPLLVLELRRQYDKLKSRGGGNQEAFLRLVETWQNGSA